jgi:hypothetical protein
MVDEHVIFDLEVLQLLQLSAFWSFETARPSAGSGWGVAPWVGFAVAIILVLGPTVTFLSLLLGRGNGFWWHLIDGLTE